MRLYVIVLQVEDGALTFGVVSHPLRALESIVRTVYRPILEGQDNRLWGKAPPDSVHEFMVGLDGFVDNLQVTVGLAGWKEKQGLYKFRCCPPAASFLYE